LTAGTTRTAEHAATAPASSPRPRRRGRTVALAAGVVVIGGLATRVAAWNRSTTHPVSIAAARRHAGSDAASGDRSTTPTRFRTAERSGPPLLFRHSSAFANGSGRMPLPERRSSPEAIAAGERRPRWRRLPTKTTLSGLGGLPSDAFRGKRPCRARRDLHCDAFLRNLSHPAV
jgi:hypothetical protein